MPLDPRISTLFEHLERVRCAALADDEQAILLNLYHLREIAWDINASILAKRWAERPRPSPRPSRTLTTVEDLMS